MESGQKRRAPGRRDWETFIRVWHESTTVAEVCEKTGYKDTTAKRYAWTLRKRGIELRRLDDENPRRSAENWSQLRKLAEKLADDNEEAASPDA